MSEKLSLTANQEKLLLRYADGECGLLARRRAEKLLAQCGQAQKFLAGMRAIGGGARAALQGDIPGQHADLWPRISARIEQEERAAIFLGARSLKMQRAATPRWMWGMTGAAVAAGLTAVILTRQQPEISSTSLAAVEQAPRTVDFVAYGPRYKQETPRIVEEPAMEMDWLRSEGRVSLIHGSPKRSAVIWIKRDKGVLVPQRVPERNRSEIRMLDDNAPLAVPVSK